MSEETNILDEVKIRMAQVGGEAWIDELLIRGSAEGVRGAHLVVGWSAPGVMGATQTGITNPNPVTMETGDPLWEAIKTELYASLTQQNLDLQQQILEVNGQVEDLQEQVQQLLQQLQGGE